MPLKIIVNADDLGLSQAVNDAVFNDIEKGLATSTTMLSNGPAIEAAAKRLRSFRHCSAGVHLNLTEFHPLSPDSHRDLASILDENRCFNGNAIRQVRIDRPLLQAIYHEWCAQIEYLIGLGLEPSHLDAHHHVHTIPQMLPVLAGLRRRYGLTKVRISRNMYTDSECPSRWLLTKKRTYNLALRAVGFQTTRIFSDLETFLILCTVRPPRHASIELMTHPGAELDSVVSQSFDDWPSKLAYKAELISYRDL